LQVLVRLSNFPETTSYSGLADDARLKGFTRGIDDVPALVPHCGSAFGSGDLQPFDFVGAFCSGARI
jgi:hypothetical protein